MEVIKHVSSFLAVALASPSSGERWEQGTAAMLPLGCTKIQLWSRLLLLMTISGVFNEVPKILGILKVKLPFFYQMRVNVHLLL